ncbi:hypothetical protein EV714DRAFT_286729 [Schizophyllum commune]
MGSEKELMANCPLLRLPPEVMELTVREVGKSKDVASICQCSSHLYDVGIRTLYDMPLAHNMKSMVRLLKSIVKKPELARCVRRFTFDWAVKDAALVIGDNVLASFMRLAIRAIECMDNVCGLYMKMVPDLPELLGPRVIANLTHCSLAITKTAIPFLEANAANIVDLEFADNDAVPEPNRVLPGKIAFPRLANADVPAHIAHLVFPGTSATSATILLAYDEDERAEELKNLECLAELPLTSMKVSAAHLHPEVMPVLTRVAPRLGSLVIESIITQTPRSRQLFFRACEEHVSDFERLRGFAVSVRQGIFNFDAEVPTMKDLDKMSDIVQRLSARCRTLQFMNIGFDLFWFPTGDVWLPRTINALTQDSELINVLSTWMMNRVAKNPALMRTMISQAIRDYPAQFRELEQSHGIKIRDPEVYGDDYDFEGGEEEDQEDEGDEEEEGEEWMTDEDGGSEE